MTASPGNRPDVSNPPGLDSLRRRISDYARAMQRMKAALAAQNDDAALRAVARHGTDDPAVALLDAWAVVSDTVAFYSERIAHEGLLRTATQPGSVRELARAVGYEVDPGVAAEVDLAFTADSGPLVPEAITIPAGTPVRSVPAESTFDGPPGPAALPQTFETVADAEIRAPWNALPVIEEQPQAFGDDGEKQDGKIWLPGRVTVNPGDPVFITGGSGSPTRTVKEEPDTTTRPGWTKVTITSRFVRDGAAEVTVSTFTRRVRLFGWNAPDPNLLVVTWMAPPGIEQVPGSDPPVYQWSGFEVLPGELELDGEFPDIVPGSWLVLQQAERTEWRQVTSVRLDGQSKFAVSGPVTRVETDAANTSGGKKAESSTQTAFDRRGTVVYCVPVEHDATRGPAAGPLTGNKVTVPAFLPAFESGHRVLLVWQDGAGRPQSMSTTVQECKCKCKGDGDRQTLTLGDDLTGVPARGLVVRGNVVHASHGETVRQVLGSGDGSATFQTFPLRKGPLTFVRSAKSGGSQPELTVQVDGVEWLLVPDLGSASPTDRVYTLRLGEDGTAQVGFGDGEHGARLPTGTENVVATYRVGLGKGGAVEPDRIIQLPRRPLGVREVTNPAAATGASEPETMDQARVNAPRRVSTLDRAVSLADHERFAGGYPGIGIARADTVWDGQQDRIVVSVRTTDATDPGPEILDSLHAALSASRDPILRLEVLSGDALRFKVSVQVKRDPRWEWKRVRNDVLAALDAAYGPWKLPFARAIHATSLLSTIEKVPGVVACTMPLLSEGDHTDVTSLSAEAARWDREKSRPLAAQVLAMDDPATLTVEEMT